MVQLRQNSISPAMTAIRLTDEAGSTAANGCRSPAALHMESGGDTPNPFSSPDTSINGPAKSPPAAAAAAASQSRLRARQNSTSLATRALSSLNPARASGVIGNIFGGGSKGARDSASGSKQ